MGYSALYAPFAARSPRSSAIASIISWRTSISSWSSRGAAGLFPPLIDLLLDPGRVAPYQVVGLLRRRTGRFDTVFTHTGPAPLGDHGPSGEQHQGDHQT